MKILASPGGQYVANRSPDVTGSSTLKASQHGPVSWSEVSSSFPLTTVSSQTGNTCTIWQGLCFSIDNQV